MWKLGRFYSGGGLRKGCSSPSFSLTSDLPSASFVVHTILSAMLHISYVSQQLAAWSVAIRLNEHICMKWWKETTVKRLHRKMESVSLVNSYLIVLVIAAGPIKHIYALIKSMFSTMSWWMITTQGRKWGIFAPKPIGQSWGQLSTLKMEEEKMEGEDVSVFKSVFYDTQQ